MTIEKAPPKSFRITHGLDRKLEIEGRVLTMGPENDLMSWLDSLPEKMNFLEPVI